jgi:DNA polymerase-3 subunit epsilon
MQTDQHEAMARTLEATGRYRVMRRLTQRPAVEPNDGCETRLGLFVDTETTGLDHRRDEVIELAMVRFTYGIDGRVSFEKLRQPSRPIPDAVTALTGISNEMVAGKKLHPAEIVAYADSADLICAHNAAFDRGFLEGLSDLFVRKPWACSMSQIRWADEGLGYQAGLSRDGRGLLLRPSSGRKRLRRGRTARLPAAEIGSNRNEPSPAGRPRDGLADLGRKFPVRG